MSSVEDQSSQGLSRVREQLHPSVPLKDRRRVARTLLEDPALHPALAYYACEALLPEVDEGIPSPERLEELGLLLALAEDVILYDPVLRATLADRLFDTAFRLRAVSEGADLLIASALRRYASLQAWEGLPRLVAFLDPSARRVPRQVVMKCVQNILSVRPLLDPSGIGEFRDRIGQLAFLYANPDVLLSLEMDALCLNAYKAAILVGVSDDLPLTERFLQLKLLVTESLVLVPLQKALEAWKRLRPTVEPGPLAALFDAEIARLAQVCEALSHGLLPDVPRQGP